ncbi:DUF6256 family protein [Streptomyces spiramyceticus]|uniref:DUF6256 family protein n=1 Tax=Streptomyces spiramyceticus TaxID=299717 RepID=UPI003B75BA7B
MWWVSRAWGAGLARTPVAQVSDVDAEVGGNARQPAGRFLSSAFTGAAVLVGISLPVFFVASWLVEWLRRGRRSR